MHKTNDKSLNFSFFTASTPPTHLTSCSISAFQQPPQQHRLPHAPHCSRPMKTSCRTLQIYLLSFAPSFSKTMQPTRKRIRSSCSHTRRCRRQTVGTTMTRRARVEATFQRNTIASSTRRTSCSYLNAKMKNPLLSIHI
jgi:hypothetical protein